MNDTTLFDRVASILIAIANALTSTGDPTPPKHSPDPDKPGDIATVTQVTDGDTFDVKYEDGGRETVRMVGIDTPETAKQYQSPHEYNVPDTTQGREWLRMWGDQAMMFSAQAMAEVDEVRIVTDDTAGDEGYYGRRLAYVYVGGESLAKELLSHGLARVYTGEEFGKEGEYIDIEQAAQSAGRGLWGYQ